MSGAFFTEDYIDLVKFSKLGELAKDLDNVEFMKDYFDGVDFSQYSNYMREVIMIHSDDILYDEDLEEKGFYIGIPLYEIPEHLSIKRICIDVRTLLTNSGFIDSDVDMNAIKIFSKILKIEEEEED